MLSVASQRMLSQAATLTARGGASVRCMSVIALKDSEAVEKFKTTNSKAILYFTASWCPPCRQIGPIYQKMAEDTTGVAFGKIDVDENADSAQEYEIAAVPTFIGVEGDEVIARFSGADTKQLEILVKELGSS